MMLLGQMKWKWLIHDNTGRYWLVFGGDWSVWGGTGWFLMVLGQYWVVTGHYRAVLAGNWWYLVSMERYWLVLGGTG